MAHIAVSPNLEGSTEIPWASTLPSHQTGRVRTDNSDLHVPLNEGACQRVSFGWLDESILHDLNTRVTFTPTDAQPSLQTGLLRQGDRDPPKGEDGLGRNSLQVARWTSSPLLKHRPCHRTGRSVSSSAVFVPENELCEGVPSYSVTSSTLKLTLNSMSLHQSFLPATQTISDNWGYNPFSSVDQSRMSLATARLPSEDMADVNLAKLYASGEFADCTFVSSEGQKFEAHRFLLSQYPRLKELIDEDHRLKLTESTEVAERLVRWLYGLDWEPENVQPTRVGIGKELTDIISLCEAAEKVSSPPLPRCRLLANNWFAVCAPEAG